MPEFILKNHAPELAYIDGMLAKTRQNYALAKILFSKLFQEMPVQMQQVEQALANQDMQSAIDIIHKLNGSLGFCGFRKLQEVCNRLEVALLQNNQALIKPVFLQLKQEISTFQTLQNRILQHLEERG